MKPNTEGERTAKVIAKDSIPLFAGRPRRERVIGKDDLMDLDILLHTANTVEEFLAKV